MTNIENQETQFMIYRDGQVDKAYYYKVQAEKALRLVGHLAYVALETTVNVLDELVASAQ